MSKEYINRELLENALENENKNGNFVFTANWIMEIVDNLPTDDVVPKSEVDKLKQDLEISKISIDNRNIELEAMRNAANSYKMHYEKARQEVAREIFEEIEKYKRSPMPECKPVYVINYSGFAELKKKYTEGT